MNRILNSGMDRGYSSTPPGISTLEAGRIKCSVDRGSTSSRQDKSTMVCLKTPLKTEQAVTFMKTQPLHTQAIGRMTLKMVVDYSILPNNTTKDNGNMVSNMESVTTKTRTIASFM